MDPLRLLVGTGSIIAGVVQLREGLKKSRSSSVGRTETIRKGDMTAKIHTVRTMDQRVRHIIRSIQKGREDPEMRRFALSVVSQRCGNEWCIPERDWWGESRALFNAVRKSVRYTGDIYKVDTFQHPTKWTLKYGGGDCDDYTITLGSALQAIGHNVILRIVQSSDAPDFNHIFLLDCLPPGRPSKCYALDASENRPAGWHPPMNQIVKIKDYEVS